MVNHVSVEVPEVRMIDEDHGKKKNVVHSGIIQLCKLRSDRVEDHLLQVIILIINSSSIRLMVCKLLVPYILTS
jgi:hypothetical protein